MRAIRSSLGRVLRLPGHSNLLSGGLISLVSLVLFLGVWEFVVDIRWINRILLPPPSAIVKEVWRNLVSIVTGGPIFQHFYVTVLQILIGFGISLVLGLVIAVLVSEVSLLRRAIYPYIIAFNSLPRVAFAPLFVIWFGFGIWSRIAMVIAIATFPIIVNTIAGLNATDPDALKLMRALGATRLQTLVRVRIPYLLPYFFAGLELAMVLAVIGAIIAEFAAGNKGLGYLMTIDQQHLATDDAFAILVILCGLSLSLHRLIVLLRERFVFWHLRRP